jgi:hypothetical protein
MPEKSDPSSRDEGREARETDAAAPDESPARASGKTVLGLGLASALNIACIAFIAYHFSHADEAPAKEVIVELRPGNITLEPGSTMHLAIASHLEPEDPVEETPAVDIVNEPTVDIMDEPEMAASEIDAPPPSAMEPVQPQAMFETPEAMESPMSDLGAVSWVQVGALSRLQTAEAVWSDLQDRHRDLLAGRPSDIVGPDRIGGRLYHLRIGPFSAEEAADLCQDLKRAGADCFSISDEAAEAEPS